MLKRNMSLAPREATDPFAMLRSMAADFDKFFANTGWPIFRNGVKADVAGWWPGLDVYEKNNMLVAKVDLPGVKKEDVKIEFVDGQLTISGERKHEVEEKKENFYRCERETGVFFRTIPLPEGIKAEQVAASFNDGVLEVTVPLPVAKPVTQKIAITEAPAKAA
jgi:HSP20 family protein